MRRLQSHRKFLSACFGAVGIGIALAGCAASSADPTPAAQAVAKAPRTPMEEDGLPAQVPPPARIRQQEDDPTEPFSPNYGTRRLSGAVAEATRLTSAEEDAIIARAITEHEMRRP